MNRLEYLCRLCATVGPIGYLPASGTCASIFTALCAYAVPPIPFIYALPFLLALTIGSAFCIARALNYLPGADPRECVLDEVVGMAWVLVGVEKTIYAYMCALILFRLFDITKWCGVSYIERFAGWRGVLGDDLYAALLARICLEFWLRL